MKSKNKRDKNIKKPKKKRTDIAQSTFGNNARCAVLREFDDSNTEDSDE